ncbi:MAG TPA: ATP-binding protein [Gammaproteobacteria bacterium]|nr:ATP-binding protein [Gammaproteobacteria bacterium]
MATGTKSMSSDQLLARGSTTPGSTGSSPSGRPFAGAPPDARVTSPTLPDSRDARWLQSMLDFIPIPAMLIEPATASIHFTNDAADEIASLHAEELAADWGTIVTAAGEAMRAEDFISTRLAYGERLHQLELQWQLPSGTRHLLLSGGKLPPVDGEPSLIVLTLEDITPLKQVEAELREASRRKDEFLAMLAHELRNPLMPIRNALAVLPRADSREAAERARRMMDRQVRRMTRLIDDLLDVSRISRGRMSLQKERIELQRAIRNAVETTQPLISANRQQLDVSLPRDPIHLDGDQTRVEQIVTNLLTNAAKYTPAGGNIRLAANIEGDDVVMSVRDDGVGIPPDKLTQIFDLFSQVADGSGRSRSGLGIGLTLVQRLAEMHGGSVSARSEGRDQGSEFIVRLPCLPEAVSATGEASESDRCRVLIVDDNKDVADSLGMMLELMDCEIRTVYDGFSALDAAAEFEPHVIFLDVGLPELDGYEVARRLRARPGNDLTALIALTGWSQEQHKQRAADAGFDRHFVKPADPAEIEKLLDELRPAMTTH